MTTSHECPPRSHFCTALVPHRACRSATFRTTEQLGAEFFAPVVRAFPSSLPTSPLPNLHPLLTLLASSVRRDPEAMSGLAKFAKGKAKAAKLSEADLAAKVAAGTPITAEDVMQLGACTEGTAPFAAPPARTPFLSPCAAHTEVRRPAQEEGHRRPYFRWRRRPSDPCHELAPPPLHPRPAPAASDTIPLLPPVPRSTSLPGWRLTAGQSTSASRPTMCTRLTSSRTSCATWTWGSPFSRWRRMRTPSSRWLTMTTIRVRLPSARLPAVMTAAY